MTAFQTAAGSIYRRVLPFFYRTLVGTFHVVLACSFLLLLKYICSCAFAELGATGHTRRMGLVGQGRAGGGFGDRANE